MVSLIFRFIYPQDLNAKHILSTNRLVFIIFTLFSWFYFKGSLTLQERSNNTIGIFHISFTEVISWSMSIHHTINSLDDLFVLRHHFKTRQLQQFKQSSRFSSTTSLFIILRSGECYQELSALFLNTYGSYNSEELYRMYVSFNLECNYFYII